MLEFVTAWINTDRRPAGSPVTARKGGWWDQKVLGAPIVLASSKKSRGGKANFLGLSRRAKKPKGKKEGDRNRAGCEVAFTRNGTGKKGHGGLWTVSTGIMSKRAARTGRRRTAPKTKIVGHPSAHSAKCIRAKEADTWDVLQF